MFSTPWSSRILFCLRGTAKRGPFEYDVRLNTSTRTVPELNDLPIKVVGNSTRCRQESLLPLAAEVPARRSSGSAWRGVPAPFSSYSGAFRKSDHVAG